MRRAALDSGYRCRIVIDGKRPAEADVDAFAANDVADVADREGLDIEDFVIERMLQNKIVSALLHGLESSEKSVLKVNSSLVSSGRTLYSMSIRGEKM